jgi:uncharacterized protein YjbJ (UPF0337 family)
MPESGKATEAKGRFEEAVGVLRGDKQLHGKGQNNQSFGKIKQANEKLKAAVDNLKGALNK